MIRLLLLLASLLSLSLGQIRIGDLSTKQHNVSGTVFAVNTRTLRITNFYYDGLGPAGAFWLDTGSAPTTAGRTLPFLETCQPDEKLRRYAGETVDLELPPDITLEDVGYLSVWCISQKAEFGGIAIDTEELDPILNLDEATCPQRAQEGTTGVVPVREGWNCEPLAGNFQVRWRLVNNMTTVNFELVARLRDGDQWMSFGLSGSDEASMMQGGDVAVAYRREEEFFAIDYHLQQGAQRPCSPRDSSGVCPDTISNRTDGVDDVTEVSGEFKDGFTVVRYSRSVKGTDPDLDKDINIDGPSFVIWAFGPLQTNPQELFPLFHNDPLSRPAEGENVIIEFGREPANNCERGFDVPSEEPADIPGFERPVLYNVTSITARIGPSGGVRGVPAILDRASWGIAWYLSETGPDSEDILIPALGVERGKTYEFNIFGGIPAAEDDGSVHPFYITSSPRGGYDRRTPKQRAENETVYAGIKVTERNRNGGVVAYESSAGALCMLSTNATDTAAIETYNDFFGTLDRSCTRNPTITRNGGKLKWKVEEDTPDTVYYQCVTHESLGFKIRVFDAGKIDVAELREMSGGGRLQEEEEEASDSCVAEFKNERRFFTGCAKGVGDAVDIFWNIDEEEGQIETLFRAPKGDGGVGYVGLGWGFSSMVGSSAVMAFELEDGPQIGDYFLEARNPAGVQPNTNQKLISSEADSTEEYLSGLFTRNLVVDGLPPITLDGRTDLIWAVGRRPRSAREFATHSDSGPGSLDLSVRSGSQVFEEANNLDTIFVVHAVFMGVSWLLLVPLAITAMRFLKKYNPLTFNVHRGLNGAAAVLTIAGFIMALTSGSRTETAHLAIGSIVFSVVILQALAGVFRPRKDQKFRRPWYWGHSITGSLLGGLGIANCFIGIGTNKIGGPVGWYIAAGVVTGLIIAVQIVMAFMPNTFPREDEEEAKSRLREERVQSGGGRTFVRDD